MAGKLILAIINHAAHIAAGPVFFQLLQRLLMLQQKLLGLGGIRLLQLAGKGCRILARRQHKLLLRLLVQLIQLAAQLQGHLLGNIGNRLRLLRFRQLLQQILHGNLRIGNGRHGHHRLQAVIYAHWVINLKMILADFIAAARCASQHLLKQDTRFHAAHKHQRGNLRYVDTGSQQIHRHHNAREAFVLKAFDFLLNLFLVTVGHAAGNLHNRVAVQIILGIKLLQHAHNHIGMRIGSSVNQRFAVGFRRVGIKIFCNLRQHRPVEFGHDNLAVELVHIKLHIIVQIGSVDFARLFIDIFNSIALVYCNSLLAELRFQLMRCVMVNQVTVQHSLAITIGINRLAENFRRLQGRRCGERNFYRVKII